MRKAVLFSTIFFAIFFSVMSANAGFKEHQAIPTQGAADWESFSIDGTPYIAVANRTIGSTINLNSAIYKWDEMTGRFDKDNPVSEIATFGANDWESFEVDGIFFLAVANLANDAHQVCINSYIYKWDGTTFNYFQTVPTCGAADWESFEIDGNTYIAVANGVGSGDNYNVKSEIFRWDEESFVSIQTIPTSGAQDWEHFTINGEDYLAVAQYFDNSSHKIDSKIYRWNGSSFVDPQPIATIGAMDWESFEIDGEMYLAVANYHDGSSPNIESKIYKWNETSFTEYQSIPTNGAQAWNSFELNNETYLAVANLTNWSSYNIDSKIYKWDGSSFGEVQSIQTNGAMEWESFTINNQHYLAVANLDNDSSREINSVIYKYDSGLVAYYPFNGNANDESGKDDEFRNNGDVYGATLTADKCSNEDSAYSFDGTDNYISTPVNVNPVEMPTMTMSAWIMPRSLIYSPNPWNRSAILSSDDGINSPHERALLFQNGKLLIWAGGPHWFPDVEIAIYEWQHVAVVYEENDVKFYLNGEQYSYGYPPGQGSGISNLWIGGSPGKWDEFFDGIIDEVRIYNFALSESEIQELYDDCPITDRDNDGISDDVDNCPDVYNPEQSDDDSDGLGDDCDDCPYDAENDADGDDFCGDMDNCPAISNPDQADLDEDGLGDVCDEDDDDDEVTDLEDNCPVDANADQFDFDGDGLGDVCDTDIDGDGVENDLDECDFTEVDDIVNETGCSIGQLCPVDDDYKNHGKYVSCVANAAEAFLDAGIITEDEKCAIVSEAAKSDVGKKAQKSKPVKKKK